MSTYYIHTQLFCPLEEWQTKLLVIQHPAVPGIAAFTRIPIQGIHLETVGSMSTYDLRHAVKFAGEIGMNDRVMQ